MCGVWGGGGGGGEEGRGGGRGEEREGGGEPTNTPRHEITHQRTCKIAKYQCLGQKEMRKKTPKNHPTAIAATR